jgi:hypothetical protein
MRAKNILGILLIAILGLTSCEKVFMESNPKTDNLAIFDEYSKLVKEKYAMLDYKGVDIDKMSADIRKTITSEMTDKQLFEKLGLITSSLRDCHSSLIMDKSDEDSPTAVFDMLEGYPKCFNDTILAENYIGKSVNSTIKLLEGGELGLRAAWGILNQDKNIAYLWIPSWNEEISDSEIEKIFSDLKDTKGMIFDMRLNTGGDPDLAAKFASYFTNKTIYCGYERFKTGPSANDFKDSKIYLKPSGSNYKYLKPVAVLTDRHVYSAATTFLYCVDPLDNLFTVGQKSGGGSGSVADGYLANGWYWSLSTSEFIDAKGRHLDDGVDADIPAELDLKDRTKDEIIERAILEIQKKY